MHRSRSVLLSLVLTLAWSSITLAQDEDEFFDDDEMADGDGGGDEAGEGDGDGGDEAGETVDALEEQDEADEPSGPSDAPKGWAFGPYLRFVFVPSFMLELFTEEAPTVSNAAFGAAATYRPPGGGMAFEAGIGYTSYGFEDAFRATGDPVGDTEWLESDLGLLHLTGSLLWEAELIPKTLSLEYGIGLDFGVVVGSLVRTEAVRAPGEDWQRCDAPLVPAFIAPNGQPYCEPNAGPALSAAYDETGAHYGVEEERVPPVAVTPMLPRVGIAYAPIPEIIGKLDLAYGIFQMWFGVSVAYVPNI